MNILVFGAGVIGTLYAARLQEAGHQVTVLARSSRLEHIRHYGLVLEDVDPVHPFALKVLFTWLPRPFAVYYWRRFFLTPMADYISARHACHASLEMRTLAAECRLLLGKTGGVAPALNKLYCAIDDYAAEREQPSLLRSCSYFNDSLGNRLGTP